MVELSCLLRFFDLASGEEGLVFVSNVDELTPNSLASLDLWLKHI